MRIRCRLLLLIWGMTLFFQVHLGATPTAVFVKDIRSDSGTPAGSNPINYFRYHDHVYFLAGNDKEGHEIWYTDGTAEGTKLLRDVNPGSSSSSFSFPQIVNDKLVYIGFDIGTGYEIWSSDGTNTGTTILADLLPGTQSLNSLASGVVNGVALFGGHSMTTMWRTDGTASGTIPFPSTDGLISYTDLLTINDTMFFVSYGNQGIELYKSDGTDAGTGIVRDIFPGSPSAWPQHLSKYGDMVFFRADEGSNGPELWKSDGTFVGTMLVKDINPGLSGSNPIGMTEFNGLLYFGANVSGVGSELWVSDGSSGGTVLLKDITGDSTSSSPGNFASLDDVLIFAAQRASEGRELWRTDGTSGGTVIVKDINPGSGSSTPEKLIRMGDHIYFTADDGINGVELWRTDGTTGGTTMVLNINLAGSSTPDSFYVDEVASTLYFKADNGINGIEPWISNGLSTGTVMLKNIKPDYATTNIQYMVGLNSLLLFAVDDGINGTELWKSDGSELGTSIVKDIRSGATGSNPLFLTASGNYVYFAADNGSVGSELWKSDGTNAGTTLVKDINPGSATSAVGELVDVSGTLFFTAYTSASGRELWKSDGTSIGTVLIKEIGPGSSHGQVESLGVVNGLCYFSAEISAGEMGIWKSNGTSAGTVPIASASQIVLMTEFKNQPFFKATAFYISSYRSRALWTVESATTLQLVASIQNNPYLDPISLTPADSLMFFIKSSNPSHLWVTDGTLAGSQQLENYDFGPTINDKGTPRSLGKLDDGKAIFSLSDGAHGHELWVSNGTPIGTQLIKDINPGILQSRVASPTFIGPSKVVFVAGQPETGYELWQSNGTEGGTRLLTDNISPGVYSSSPTSLILVGSNLFFLADDGVRGRELWVLDVSEIDFDPPVVQSIVCLDPQFTGASTVNFSVTFTESVENVDLDDFVLTVAGTSGASLQSLSGSGDNFIVTINTGTADGTIRLDLIDNSTIFETDLDWELGGAGLGNGDYTTGETYTIDRTPPLVSEVNDAGDYSNISLVEFLWDAATDPGLYASGIDYYNFQAGTSSGGSDLANADIGNLLTFSVGGSDGQVVYARIQAIDLAGNASSWSNSSNGILVDLSSPLASTPSDAGEYSTTNLVSFSWLAATDPGGNSSGVSEYEIQVGSAPGGNDIFAGNIGNTLTYNLTGSDGQTVYARIRAIDNAGNVGNYSGSSDGIRLDLTVPTASAPDPDSTATSSTSVLYSWIAGVDGGANPTGIESYDMQIGTTPGGSDLLNTNVGLINSHLIGGLTESNIYARIRAKDIAGNIGPWSTSSPSTLIDFTPPDSEATSPEGTIYSINPIINIEFTVNDSGPFASGIRETQLYYRKNGLTWLQYNGLFTSSPIQFNTSEITDGGSGTYEFYTIGIDMAGNKENKAAAPEITFTFNDTTQINHWQFIE